jgi:signal transduction histidine kinase
LAEQSLSSIRSVIVFAGLAVAAATGFAAYYVAGRAVRPVTAAAELAREIETTANFARRLPEVRSTREMKDLTETFNKMISRVERMITAQRAFLSDTSHELRRPLAILHTNLAVVGEANLSPDMREAVESEMRAAADTMSSLVAELLVLARSDEMNLKREAVNLSDLCRAMVATARQTAPKHHVETRIADRIWVKGDEQALARVIANVVQNATVYCDDTTSISVELDSDDVEARLCIRDTGPGMSDDDIAHAFDRFYRGAHGRKSRPDGLGLGLAIVKQIIEAHQGRIAIQSSLGVGTAVAIGLPLGAPPDS